jgi:hypothetical protein
VLGCSGGAEEVCLGSRRHDQVVPVQHRSGSRGDRSCFEVDRYRGRAADLNGLVLAKDPAQRPGYVKRGDLGCGELIQHWLELVVVIAVQQDHVHVMLSQLLGAGNPGEPAPNDEHCCVIHASSPSSVGRC